VLKSKLAGPHCAVACGAGSAGRRGRGTAGRRAASGRRGPADAAARLRLAGALRRRGGVAGSWPGLPSPCTRSVPARAASRGAMQTRALTGVCVSTSSAPCSVPCGEGLPSGALAVAGCQVTGGRGCCVADRAVPCRAGGGGRAAGRRGGRGHPGPQGAQRRGGRAEHGRGAGGRRALGASRPPCQRPGSVRYRAMVEQECWPAEGSLLAMHGLQAVRKVGCARAWRRCGGPAARARARRPRWRRWRSRARRGVMRRWSSARRPRRRTPSWPRCCARRAPAAGSPTARPTATHGWGQARYK
jgi:hypothetical protein